jgi:hypothetical protein
MALSILDGNQSATTLSTILSSGQHITAHTVVSLGTQAITDMRSAVSGSVVSISNLPATQTIAGTVTANVLGQNQTNFFQEPIPVDNYGNTRGNAENDLIVPVQITNDSGTLNANNPLPISGTVTIGSALPAGTNRIGVVTIGNIQRDGDGVQTSLLTEVGSGYLLNRSFLGAGTNQIGSVTASISGTVPISISSVTVGNSVTIGSLPAISGTVTANTFALQGTAVTTSNFTSTTASTVLANYNATREVLTIFSEGPGQLFIAPGATCTTIAYQVRLSAGDYYEVPNHQTTITHSAVFATAGTARVCQVS